MQTYDWDTDRHDCEILKSDTQALWRVLEDSLEKIEQGNMTKKSIVGSLWGIGKGLAKLGYDSSRCAIKYTPSALAAAADTKRKLIDAGTEEYRKITREMAEEVLEEKIRNLQYATKTHEDKSPIILTDTQTHPNTSPTPSM